MEWREQSSVSCDEAYVEAQRWIEAVTKKKFGSNDFRSALENGVLLCDLINKIKPGIIKRVNRLPTPIAGLDNLNVFLKACGKLGLKEAQLFHPGDLQDLSTRVTVKHQETNRRLKNVLITVYWLGRRAQCDRFYDGPYLSFKAFEGLLGTALYKALQESSSQTSSNVRDSGFGDSWYPEREELYHRRGGGGGSTHRRDDSLDSLDSLGSRPHSISSDITLKGNSEGCCSDTEADSVFRMAENKDTFGYRRTAVITPKSSTPFNQFLPTKDKQSGYVPAPLRKKRAERNEDNRRSWASISSVEDEGTLNRQHQTEESIDGSKSTSDIQIDAAVMRQIRYEELQKHREQIKESEDKWQDDLTKWKNRRRSVNSDIVKKKEEREKIEQITYSGNRRSKTFKEMQEERENKGRNSIGSRLGSLSFLDDDDDVFDKAAISSRSRTLPTRSYTIDTPLYSSESPEPSLKTEPPAASLSTIRAPSPPTLQEDKIVDSISSTTSTTATDTPTTTPASHSSDSSSNSPEPRPLQRSQAVDYTSTTEKEEATDGVSSSSSLHKVPEPRHPLLGTQTEVEATSSGSLNKQQPQYSSMEPKPLGVSRVSASLPRNYQRSDSARLTSVIAPRPFGTQPSSITSLPRAYTMDYSQKRVNGNADVSKKTSVPSRYHPFMTSEDEAHSSSAHSSDEEDEEEAEEQTTTKKATSTQSISSVLPHVEKETLVSPALAKETSQENFCEMRISLNQKPNSSRDFGFQTTWDSTGAHVTSIQPGSPAEMCQLQVGDEVLTVNRHQVAEMSYTEWKSHLEEALQEGSLVMDIRRHGQNNWDRDQPSLPYKSHKTINLTSTDHLVLLGSPEANNISSNLEFTSNISKEPLPTKEAPAHPLSDVASNGVNGAFREKPVTMRNKESEPISLKNLKRRSEFFEQGGSESAMPDIPVPAINPSSRWSWDTEEERRRQEKWQKEQERLLQEKYKRDQEKLQEEWLKAQQELASNVGQGEPGSLEVNSHSISPYSPLSSSQQPTPPLWEEEERKRKEELERQRQEEERRKREVEERELQCLREERKRREMQEEEERKRREMQEEEARRKREIQEEEARRRKEMQEEEERKRKEEEEERKRREEEEERWQRRREEEREEERRRQEAVEQQLRERASEQQQWTGGFHGFATVKPSLFFTDRTKSKSTPQLDEDNESQTRGAHMQPKGKTPWLLEEQLRIAREQRAQIKRPSSELQLKQKNSLNVMIYREEEIETGSGIAEKRGQQSVSQSEVDRQQILNEMKKKTPLLTDSSWIRQRSSSTATNKESDMPPMRRGESLDNLDSSYNSRRFSWTPRSGSVVPNYSRPPSSLSSSTSFFVSGSGAQRPISSTLPSSYSMGSLRGGAGTHSSIWSRQSHSPSLSSSSPTTSPEPPPELRSSVLTASPASEDQKPEPKSEYETNSSIVTLATCDSKLPSQQLCDVTVLQQIDEETTCDNNP
ncbi:LIM domain only protein 7 isoform X3 [Melanotaenia boesemani]|uniref:LIM domain only protein 7 isoform X3 n=1 Tax=Melanotaenia boesemani TaxID=1250792 RepID=UPI001C040E69|nr:LIM domain only protein 7 isoform X3 [Melanotaenia boesemani]